MISEEALAHRNRAARGGGFCFARKRRQNLILVLNKVVRDTNFKSQTIKIDGSRFINCVFDGCVLVYCGGEWEINNCRALPGTRFQFEEAAKRTVGLIQKLGMLRESLDGMAAPATIQ